MQYTLCMQKELHQIATVTSGYTFRGSIENDPNGDIFVLQAKNISANKDILDIVDLIRIFSKSLRNPYFLEDNDILLVSRGSGLGSFRSVVFNSKNKNIIASSSVCVIRVNDVTVLPKYISLYLNSQDGQKAILQIVTGGSYIQSVLMGNLKELKIPIPPMHIQKSIIALNENILKQAEIIKREQEIKQNIINSIFNNLTKK